MNAELVTKIKNNPKFKELVEKRSKFAWQLSAVMLVVYYLFILTIAFSPSTLGAKIGAGVMTIGIPIGILIIIIAFALTGIYVKRANSEFDNLTNQIKQEAKAE